MLCSCIYIVVVVSRSRVRSTIPDTMSIEMSSDKLNQNYVFTEYDQNKNKCVHTTVPKQDKGVHVFRIPNGHSIRVHFSKRNLHELSANVDVRQVTVDGKLKQIFDTEWRCNRVAEQCVELLLDSMYNGISFQVYNTTAIMVFVVLPLQTKRCK